VVLLGGREAEATWDEARVARTAAVEKRRVFMMELLWGSSLSLESSGEQEAMYSTGQPSGCTRPPSTQVYCGRPERVPCLGEVRPGTVLSCPFTSR
jgi:hypothetical protein